jgi:hypothetical protein
MSFGLIERSRIYGRIALNTLRVVHSHNIQKVHHVDTSTQILSLMSLR